MTRNTSLVLFLENPHSFKVTEISHWYFILTRWIFSLKHQSYFRLEIIKNCHDHVTGCSYNVFRALDERDEWHRALRVFEMPKAKVHRDVVSLWDFWDCLSWGLHHEQGYLA